MHESNSHFDSKISQPFILGRLLVSPSQNQIEIDNKVIKVQPKAMSVLAYLAKHSERVISSDELIQTLWVGRIVTQSSVQKSINTLRKILASHFVEQVVIENYSKKGYQLKITPVYQAVTQTTINETLPSSAFFTLFKVCSILGICAFITLVYLSLQYFSNKIELNKQHKLHFTQATKLMSDKGHASHAEPHPNNQNLVYISTDANNAKTATNHVLLVKYEQQQDWRIASTQGKWLHIVWSPNGKHLVAVEQQPNNQQPTTPSFYGLNIYSYTFHIFTLDVANQKLIEKQLLSQWHGRVNSVTWINNNQFEFVASQGDNPLFQRYRYIPQEQHLNIQQPLIFAPQPLSSLALNGKMALLSNDHNGMKVDFVDSQQRSISSWPIQSNKIQLSWIPDGSGVLMHEAGSAELSALYLDGEQQTIPLPNINSHGDLRPRYNADGQTLIVTENQTSNIIKYHAINGNKTTVIDESNFHYGAIFSPDNSQFIYMSSDKNKTQLWLKKNNQQASLLDGSITNNISHLIWPNESFIVYKSGANIYQFNVANSHTQLLLADAEKITPIAFDPDNNLMTALIETAKTQNIWSINLNKNLYKQLTFGSIGSTLLDQQKVYFQYIGQKGLWVMNTRTSIIKQITEKLLPNSKLLSVDDNGAYYISGSTCQESDIYYQQYDLANHSVFMSRKEYNITTTDFDYRHGSLTIPCRLGTSNIMRYE